jgi:hypothetical protein
VWLRREEQLNEAREKARYAAAIRTLGRSERFEKKVLAEEALAATGTDGAPGPRAGDAGRAKGSGDTRPGEPRTGRKTSGTPDAAGARDRDGRSGTASLPKPRPLPTAQNRKGVSARLPHHDGQTTAAAPKEKRPASGSAAATAARRRGVLLMRRRRVVAFLFTLATFGALVSAVMGLDYSWAMLAPAALFSGYIAYIRRDEKQRARERYRRRQAALAAQRRQERQERQERQRQDAGQRTAPVAEAVVTEPETSVWRPMAPPQEYRRAANG